MTIDHPVVNELASRGYGVDSPKITPTGKLIFFLVAPLDFDPLDLLKTFKRSGLSVEDFKVQQEENGIYRKYQVKVTALP